MSASLPLRDPACMLCPIGAAAHRDGSKPCPMVDRRRGAETFLYLRGTPADAVYYLKHGAVALTREAGEGAPHAVRRAGMLLGLEAINRATYVDSARAISDVTVCVMGRAPLLAWLDRSGAARVVLDIAVDTLHADHLPRARIEGSALRRVARWLADGSAQRKLPRSVLAGLLGMTPATLSRALATLARGDAIRLTRSTIEVRDLARLEAIADGSLGAAELKEEHP